MTNRYCVRRGRPKKVVASDEEEADPVQQPVENGDLEDQAAAGVTGR